MDSNHRVRVLYVTPFDEAVSGADESLLLAVRNLDRSKFEPHVLLPPHAGYLDRYAATGAKIHPWNLSRMRRNYNPFFWLSYFVRLWKDIRGISDLIRRKEIKIVHLNMHVAVGALLAANRAGVPVVIHYRASTNDDPKWFFDLFLPWIHRRSDAILCISEKLVAHFEKRELRGKAKLLKNPVEFRGEELKPVKNVFSDFPRFRGKKVVLNVGRIHPRKRLSVILDALEILGKKRNDIAGAFVGSAANETEDQEHFRELQSHTAKMSVPVEWVPQTANVFPFLTSADVFVLPSLNEGFGRVLVEAMLSDVPLIGVDSGAISEVLENGKWGQVIPPDDANALAHAIEQVLDDSSWKDVASAALVHAKENFSVASHVDKLKEIYGSLIR